MKEYLGFFIVYLIVMWGILPLISRMYGVVSGWIDRSYRGDGYEQCVIGWHFAAFVFSALTTVAMGVSYILKWCFS